MWSPARADLVNGCCLSSVALPNHLCIQRSALWVMMERGPKRMPICARTFICDIISRDKLLCYNTCKRKIIPPLLPPHQPTCKRVCVLLLPSYTFCAKQVDIQMFQACRISSNYPTLPCIHLTHHTPLSRSRFCRMRWILRHRDVEKSVGATDFLLPLCRDITLPCLCRVVACGLCRLRAGCVQVELVVSYTE